MSGSDNVTGKEWPVLLIPFFLAMLIMPICNSISERSLHKKLIEAQTLLPQIRESLLQDPRQSLNEIIGSEKYSNKYKLADSTANIIATATIEHRKPGLIWSVSHECKIRIDKEGKIHYDKEFLELMKSYR